MRNRKIKAKRRTHGWEVLKARNLIGYLIVATEIGLDGAVEKHHGIQKMRGNHGFQEAVVKENYKAPPEPIRKPLQTESHHTTSR
ncbi:hypothetical protein NPIL_468031 [Nephila pilipes]|uniref:Uncharacterized protein n=1 Tax=Nephila pilipes TaxID=299642 RepID=A0A8X6NYK1_NEPPI|nr:hypothetical protein NPIL_468031 [Nephila pilipes]